MMRFIALTNKLTDAIFNFCMEQDECCCEYTDSEVRSMLDTVFSELRKIKNGVLPVTCINRYDLTIKGECEKNYMPDDAVNNSVISCEAVHLATIQIDISATDDGKKLIERGYDIIYDINADVVIPVYSVTVSDRDMISVYRVECDFVEDFCTIDFMIALGVQLADRLRNAREFLGKVCDLY
ncbi:MAG: hypothetical protein K6C68_04640 [Ruminococcus sp.]|nr:hypothetical protein [Ruminococcus sp.]